MDKLDKYLDTLIEKEDKKECCCIKEENKVVNDIGLFTCVECGTIINEIDIEDEYNYINPSIVKTFLNYNKKYSNIYRLNKWNNWVYSEIEMDKIKNYIDGLDLDSVIKNNTIMLMEKFYITDKIVSRNNVRRGLIVYCIYYSMLYHNYDVNINDLFNMCNIKISHYNSANSKLKENILYYPNNLENLDIDNQLKNDIIKEYNYLIEKYCKLNKKTIFYFIINKLIPNNEYNLPFNKITLNKLIKLIK